MAEEEKDREYNKILEMLEINRQQHIKELRSALLQLVPKEPYESTYNMKTSTISPEMGKRQVNELAIKIANLVYDRLRAIFLRYKKLPIGGNFGNICDYFNRLFLDEPVIKRQMECGDWTVLIYFILSVINKCDFIQYCRVASNHQIRDAIAGKDSPPRFSKYPASGSIDYEGASAS